MSPSDPKVPRSALSTLSTLNDPLDPPSARAIKARWRHIHGNALGGAGWGVPIALVGERRSTTQRRRWESPGAAVGTSKARTNAAAPKADAQVGLNGDFSRTMAFGAGGGVLKCDCKPRKSAFPSLSFRRPTDPPHAAAPDGGTHNQGLIGDSYRNIPIGRGNGCPLSLSRVDRRLRAPKVRFPFAFLSPPPLNRHFTTSQPPPPLSLSLSFLSRFSTHDPTLRRLLTRFLTSFLNPFALPMAAFAAGSGVGWISQPVIKPTLILLPPPDPWLLRPLRFALRLGPRRFTTRALSASVPLRRGNAPVVLF